MRKALYAMLVTLLSAAVVCLAIVVTFFAASFFVLTDPAHTGAPGSVRYETREFWLSVDDKINGRNTEWTAEIPDIAKRSL